MASTVLLVLGGLVGLVARASGQELPLPRSAPRQVRLFYSRGAGVTSCPASSQALRDEVSARLGYDAFSDSAERTISARVDAHGAGLTGRLSLTTPGAPDPREQRLESRSGDCHALIEAMSVAISLAIAPLDPSAHSERPPAPPPLPPPQEPEGGELAEDVAKPVAVVPVSRAERAADPLPATGPRLTLHAALGGDLAVGRAPSLAGGVLLAFEARWTNFSVGLEGHVLLPAQKAVNGGTIQTSLVEAVVDPCFRRGVFGFCGLVAAGVQAASGSGFPVSTQDTTALFDLGGRVLAEMPLGSGVELWLFADVLAPLIQALVQVDKVVEWQEPGVSLSLGMAIGVTIP